jgi:hypothetical protein
VKRISSRWTHFYKRTYPIIWFGSLAAMIVGLIWTTGTDANDRTIVGPIFIAVIGYVLMRFFVFDLVDEVWDAGDYFIFKNNGVEEMVRLDNIINVSSSTFINPPRVTLSLRTPSRLGKKITFTPPGWMTPFNAFKNPIVDELIDRADRARSR